MVQRILNAHPQLAAESVERLARLYEVPDKPGAFAIWKQKFAELSAAK
ncbi:MAG: hypothetical protein QOF48_2167, partial [Verrucomicrobiota bacterium]